MNRNKKINDREISIRQNMYTISDNMEIKKSVIKEIKKKKIDVNVND